MEMIPATFTPETGVSGSSSPNWPGGSSQSSGLGELEREEELCCPNCGLTTPASELPSLLLPQLVQRFDAKRQQVAVLKEELSLAKEKWSDLVQAKQRLAGLWNKVLRARTTIFLLERACEDKIKQSRKESEELQLLERTNRRRSERLQQVASKDFGRKEKRLAAVVAEEREQVSRKLDELVALRQRFVTELYQRVFPIEVLPLSQEDEGGTDYYSHVEIDCDQVLELEGGWVLGGVHSHPTPHISIVAPSLPANGDHTPYLHALSERTRNKGGVVPEASVHPLNDPYLSTPAALLYVAHLVEVIAWAVDQPLPFPLRRPVAISVYGNPMKRKRSFLEWTAKLDDNIMYLCFSQKVPPTALAPGHTLQNLLALVTHTQLGRSGPFECYPELTSYKGSLRRTRSAGVSPMSHDADDSQPPNVSYTGESTYSSTCSEGEGEGEGEEGEEGEEEGDVSGNLMDWEHLEPRAEEVRMFEEEQMRLQALALSPASDRLGVAHRHAQEVEDYRQRLRRLDYDATYSAYAAHASTPSPQLDSTTGRLSAACLASDGMSSVSSGSRISEESLGRTGESAVAASGPAQQGVTSGILGTLSSLWTSTFGSSR